MTQQPAMDPAVTIPLIIIERRNANARTNGKKPE